MKYKVGDKVRVRKDLEVGESYGVMCFLRDMAKYRGEVVTIDRIKNRCYGIKGYPNEYWEDEMFEGLAEDTKFKVGDKIKVVCTLLPSKEIFIGRVFTISDLNPNGRNTFDDPHYGVNEPDCMYVWRESEVELVEEEPKPTPTPTPTPVININVTVNNYDNACWYCRKGGLVDLYLDGVMGICPNCKRVCNEARGKGFTLTNTRKIVVEFKPKPEKRENKPLTTEEIKALPIGSKVFVVKMNDGVEDLTHSYTCWRKVDDEFGKLSLKRKCGFCWVDECNTDRGISYHVYLEMPEGAVDSGD